MSKLLILLSLCLALSGCVLYSPTSITYQTVIHYESTSSSKLETKSTNEVSERVVQKKPIIKQRLLAECKPFVLPRGDHRPTRLTRRDLENKTQEELDKLLVGKIEELQTYINSYRSKIEQAHQKWLETCLQSVPK